MLQKKFPPTQNKMLRVSLYLYEFTQSTTHNTSMNKISPVPLTKYAAALWTVVATLSMAAPVEAQRLKYQNGGFEAWSRFYLSSQIAALDTEMPIRNSENMPFQNSGSWPVSGSVRLNAQWITQSALTYGLRIEYDTATRTAEEYQRDEMYLYFVSDLGRIELGEQDGPADTLAFHAPIIGQGQIRGDFSRYVGRQALLSAYDTSDAPKLVYLTPPLHGWRFGVSYAPELTKNLDKKRVRDQTHQRNAMEFGAQYQTDLGDWVAGVSGGYVTGDADPLTERADLNSWSIGGELRRGRFTFGTAYVWRGDSNLRTKNYNQDEFNVGVSWRGRKWRGALSGVRSTSIKRVYDVYGIGAAVKLTPWLSWRTDLVRYDEITTSDSQGATVLLTELEIRL